MGEESVIVSLPSLNVRPKHPNDNQRARTKLDCAGDRRLVNCVRGRSPKILKKLIFLSFMATSKLGNQRAIFISQRISFKVEFQDVS